MFLVAQDFVAPYTIPNADRVINTLGDFINREELNVLRKVLGVGFTKEFIEGISAPTPLQKWIDLRDGKYYTYYQAEYYGGIKTVLLPYVYSRWVRYNVAHFTGVGVVQSDAENANVISSAVVEVQFYNEASDALCKLHQFIMANANDYQGVEFGNLGYMNMLCL
jgi:hypothetical protein